MDTVEVKNKSMNNQYEHQLEDWIGFEKAAIELINIVGNLWFDNSVELLIFRNQMVDRSASEILNLHEYAKTIVDKPITVKETLLLARAISELEIAPSRIDIGRLSAEWLEESNNFASATDFVGAKLTELIGSDKRTLESKDVILYGFGRIGRLAARELVAQAGKGEQLRLRAIVTRKSSDEDIIKRASLLRMDSVHGPFPGTIVEDLENKAIIVNGHSIKMIAADDPTTIDYTQYGISNALVIDNTGAWRDRAGLGKHLKSKGVDRVLLTAPGKEGIPNIVYGVNQHTVDLDQEEIYSAASCTTNAIVPPLEVIENSFGIESGHIETVHSYTNDQNLLDNYHKKYRRGRSAALNMVITETGAGKAVAKVIPGLSGKLTANAVRVPTPDGSLAIMNLTLKKEVSVEEVNRALRCAALEGDLVEQIQYSVSNELVSSDIIGNSCCAVFDSPATIVSNNKKNVVLYVWYDNEYGYTRQVMRLAKHIAKVRRLRYY